MSETWVMITIFVGIGLFYLVATELIDVYFRRKEKFVDDLYDKTKGSTDGKNE